MGVVTVVDETRARYELGSCATTNHRLHSAIAPPDRRTVHVRTPRGRTTHFRPNRSRLSPGCSVALAHREHVALVEGAARRQSKGRTEVGEWGKGPAEAAADDHSAVALIVCSRANALFLLKAS